MKDQVPDEKDVQSEERTPAQELLNELTFEPDWARRNPAAPPQGFRKEERERPPRREGHRSGFSKGARPERASGERPARRPDRRSSDRPPRPETRPETRPAAGAPRTAAGRPPFRRAPESDRPFTPSLPVDIYFLPDQDRLAAVVHELHESRRAYSLVDMANRFMAATNLFRVKIEVRKNTEPSQPLWQCKLCRLCSMDEDALRAHFMAAHMTEFFEVLDVEADPLSGNFICIGRCGFSGELLAPPNHHSYADKVLEVRQRVRPGLPLEKYKERIEMVKDETLIEQWRDQTRRRTEYRLKKVPEGETPQAMTRAQAEEWLASRETARRVVAVKRAVISATQIAEIPDARLRTQVEQAQQKEKKFPFSLMIALRAAFRHMKLFLFKAGKANFVSSIQPVRLPDEKAANEIVEIFTWLKEHRGRTRHELIEALRPGALAKGEEAASKLINELAWLLERGHLIEFHDGSIALPGQAFKSRKNVDADRPIPAAPASVPAEEAPAATEPQGEEGVRTAAVSIELAKAGNQVEGGNLKSEGEEKPEAAEEVAAKVKSVEPDVESVIPGDTMASTGVELEVSKEEGAEPEEDADR